MTGSDAAGNATAGPAPPPASSATATGTSTGTATPAATEEAQPGRAAEVGARAIATVATLRLGGEPALIVSSADGARYEVAGGAGGVELRAVTPPLLERVARADLHAVAGACDRRGLPLRRATVRVEGRGGGGARGRKR